MVRLIFHNMNYPYKEEGSVYEILEPVPGMTCEDCGEQKMKTFQCYPVEDMMRAGERADTLCAQCIIKQGVEEDRMDDLVEETIYYEK